MPSKKNNNQLPKISKANASKKIIRKKLPKLTKGKLLNSSGEESEHNEFDFSASDNEHFDSDNSESENINDSDEFTSEDEGSEIDIPITKKYNRLKNTPLQLSDIKTLGESDNMSNLKTKSSGGMGIIPKGSIKKNSNEIFKELIKRQLPNVPQQWKLNINDMKRICKYINTSIFDNNSCCIWNGYITNMNNSNKGTYVNFYFRNKKVALHRLLYSNFVAPLDSSEYLKFNCDNKGICCNINHYEKYKYAKNSTSIKRNQKAKDIKKDIKEISIVSSNDNEKIIIDFD